ncbi:MAG: hypothetical protein Q8M88_17430 [Phenylobacterium sp.]|uniref:hypothetical protein n=1 Tax=Phenylobacterium sp. TaxID=1871053 RepID=UPI0027351EC6|nr:hypothetical protein [Phenylobacterium sp.]MDP3176208.1 hypothetical protein [Phenylobacterium sp.]
MDFLKDRQGRLVLIGGALALLAGLGIAAGLGLRHRDDTPPPPPASQGGLVIETGQGEEASLDPAKPLRCFVAGQFVGELTLSDCATRNGVATGALDVGVDETGALAAADAAGTVLTPLPPVTVALQPKPASAPVAVAPAAGPPAGACWRYAQGEWRQLPADLSLDGCVQALFAGRCERPGAATYGRWMAQTLRLVPGRVEVSGDNRSFRKLADQAAGCVIPPLA